MLQIKQRESNEKFVQVFERISSFISKEELDNKIDLTAENIKLMIKNKNVGYAWSGGKDSIALQFFMDLLNIKRCVIGLTYDLEYPEHLRFVTDVMPDGLEVFNSGLSLDWLSKNQEMLFPKTSVIAAKWFKNIQHKAQDGFFNKHKLDIICLGRRKLDANHIGKDSNIYTNNKGITRYSPIAYWTHEEVLALIYYYKLPHSPIYSWLNGYVVGTGSWAARQWTGSIEQGWRELYIIDKSIVRFASTKIQSAKQFLEKL